MGRAWVISGGRDSGERSTASPATDATTLLYLLAVVLVAGDGRKLCETKPHCRTHGCGNLTLSFLTGSHLQTGNSKIQLTARCRTRPLRREKRSFFFCVFDSMAAFMWVTLQKLEHAAATPERARALRLPLRISRRERGKRPALEFWRVADRLRYM